MNGLMGFVLGAAVEYLIEDQIMRRKLAHARRVRHIKQVLKGRRMSGAEITLATQLPGPTVLRTLASMQDRREVVSHRHGDSDRLYYLPRSEDDWGDHFGDFEA